MSDAKLSKDLVSRFSTAILTIVFSIIGFLLREGFHEVQRRLEVIERIASERGDSLARLQERSDSCRDNITSLELSNRESGRAITYFFESIKELKECCKDNRDKITQGRGSK